MVALECLYLGEGEGAGRPGCSENELGETQRGQLWLGGFHLCAFPCLLFLPAVRRSAWFIRVGYIYIRYLFFISTSLHGKGLAG